MPEVIIRKNRRMIKASIGDSVSIQAMPVYDACREVADYRVRGGLTARITLEDMPVRECAIFIPGSKPRLVRSSIIRSNMRFDTSGFWDDELYVHQDALPGVLEGSIDFPEEPVSFEASNLHRIALLVYLLGGVDQAYQYGKLLLKAGIGEMEVKPVDKRFVNLQRTPFCRQLRLRGINKEGYGGIDAHTSLGSNYWSSLLPLPKT